MPEPMISKTNNQKTIPPFTERLNEIAQILLKGIYRLKVRQEGLQSPLNQLDSAFYSSTDNAVNINHQQNSDYE